MICIIYTHIIHVIYTIKTDLNIGETMKAHAKLYIRETHAQKLERLAIKMANQTTQTKIGDSRWKSQD